MHHLVLLPVFLFVYPLLSRGASWSFASFPSGILVLTAEPLLFGGIRVFSTPSATFVPCWNYPPQRIPTLPPTHSTVDMLKVQSDMADSKDSKGARESGTFTGSKLLVLTYLPTTHRYWMASANHTLVTQADLIKLIRNQESTQTVNPFRDQLLQIPDA